MADQGIPRGISRRNFLQGSAAAAFLGALPGCGSSSIVAAQSIPANSRTGTIKDVEHIVVLMQENRSFDHYFGTMKGVRGFGDPHPYTLPSGKAVWHQADGAGTDFLPFHPMAPNLGLQYMVDLSHSWPTQHQALNLGNFDQWVPAKTFETMAYLKRDDIPFHYALADAFTVCDGYHCSLLGPTDPNRYHMWTGWVGNDGKGGGPVIDNSEAGYSWTTYPERLEQAGISWKIYQDIGTGLDAANSWGDSSDAYIGNYGDNSLLYFDAYRNAQPGDPLYDKARTGTNVAVSGGLFDILKADVQNNRLPQISWIVAPEAYSEHGNWPANYGALYQSQVLDALTSNPEVWSKTALFITYDENDGFFDHMVPPFPPASPDQGASTVETTNDIYAGSSGNTAGPYGLGMRVPMTVVSPWSKGGFVCSQVFDHTSIIRFMELRFGVHEPNITPWRRAVCGDLTAAFNFANPDASAPELPSTTAYTPPDSNRHPTYYPLPDAAATLPKQEPGMRPARALPYRFAAQGSIDGKGGFGIAFANTGAAGAQFLVTSSNRGDGPWTYTVEAGKSLSAAWDTQGSSGSYQFTAYGANGFLRQFAGMAAPTQASPEAQTAETSGGNLQLTLSNQGSAACVFTIANAYGNQPAVTQTVAPGKSVVQTVDLSGSNHWYDLSVTADSDSSFLRRFCGHVETGKPSTSDPAIITS